MKRTFFLSVVFSFMLVAGYVGAASAASIDIVYDGYCDGARINYNVATGEADGWQTGSCVDIGTGNYMVGAVASVFGQGAGVTMGYDDTALYGTYGLFTVIRADGTWTHYANDGSGIIVINSGTWSYGTPPVNAEGLSSSAGK